MGAIRDLKYEYHSGSHITQDFQAALSRPEELGIVVRVPQIALCSSNG